LIKNVEITYSIPVEFVLSISRLNNKDKFELSEERLDSDMLDKIKPNDEITDWVNKTLPRIPEKYLSLIDLAFNGETCFRSVFLYYTRANSCETVEDLLRVASEKSGAVLISRFFSMLTFHIKSMEFKNDAYFLELLKNRAELMTFIEKLPFSPQRKWELLQLCNKTEDFKTSLFEFLEWYYEHVFKKEIKKIVSILTTKKKDTERKVNNYGNKYVSLLINIDYSSDTINRNLIIVLSYYQEISYIVIFRDDFEEDIFILGYRHSELFVDRKHDLLSNVHLFKALGDETRLNIIKLLANREWYGDELAQEMKLSNSTVSYHLGILMLEGFVKVKRTENRNYVTLNNENFRTIMDNAIKKMIGEQ